MTLEIVSSFANSLFVLLVGLGISAYAVYASMRLFDKLTSRIDEWKELKKGNLAVALLFASVILSLSLLMENPLRLSLSILAPGTTFLLLLASILVALLMILISLVLSILTLFTSVRLVDFFTKDIDEMEELKKGNIAVSLVLSSALIALSFLIRSALFDVLVSLNLSSLLAHFL